MAVDPASTSPTDRAIGDAQARLRRNDEDGQAKLDLARAFLQKAREVADPTYYAKAEGLLADAAKLRPDDPAVLFAQGALALARHSFEEAFDVGQRALRAAPGSAAALGIVVDAANELGRYDEALEATQAMVDARPDLASLSRVSYARELRGDLDGAALAMSQAVGAATKGGENLAYTQVQLGNLLLTSGDLDGAEAQYAAADQAFPGFAAAKGGRARALLARGDVAGAAAVWGELVRVQPLLEYAVAHGDALAAGGRPDEAARAYELVEAIAKLYRANGANVDMEMALVDADLAPGDDAVKRARKVVERQPSVFAHDVLAWNLYRAGEVDEAWSEARAALALGTKDPQVRLHAAVIALARGDRAAATEHLGVVLDTNPRFSARHLSLVERTAADLGLSVPPPPPAP